MAVIDGQRRAGWRDRACVDMCEGAGGQAMARTQEATWTQRSASGALQSSATLHDANRELMPSFAIDGAGLERAPAAPPEDQPNAPAMRWLKLIAPESGRLTCGVWDCQAGVFDVHFKCDEVVHILEGEVTVHAGDHAQTFRPGDVALFPEGLVTRWEVPRYVRKLWFHHFRKPTLRERVAYKIRMLLGRLPER